MTSNDVFALAAHMPVLLRRQTGRVTGTEWLTTNADCAGEIVRFTPEKAAGDANSDLLALADTLKASQVSATDAQRAAT